MIRGIISIIVLILDVGVVGTSLFVIGLFHPSRPIFAVGARLWSRVILWVTGVRLTIEGADRIADGVPRFYMSNHQSALDIPILFTALRGDVRFMAKDSLFRIPVFGWVLSRYRFAPINRKHARVTLRMLEAMLKRLKTNPVSFAVFPEGTRTYDGKLLVFRQGTMKVGQRSGLDIVPITIDGSLDVYHRERPYEITPGSVRVVISQPIPAAEAASMSSAQLRQRIVETINRELGEPVAVASPSAAAPAAVEVS